MFERRIVKLHPLGGPGGTTGEHLHGDAAVGLRLHGLAAPRKGREFAIGGKRQRQRPLSGRDLEQVGGRVLLAGYEGRARELLEVGGELLPPLMRVDGDDAAAPSASFLDFN